MWSRLVETRVNLDTIFFSFFRKQKRKRKKTRWIRFRREFFVSICFKSVEIKFTFGRERVFERFPPFSVTGRIRKRNLTSSFESPAEVWRFILLFLQDADLLNRVTVSKAKLRGNYVLSTCCSCSCYISACIPRVYVTCLNAMIGFADNDIASKIFNLILVSV